MVTFLTQSLILMSKMGCEGITWVAGLLWNIFVVAWITTNLYKRILVNYIGTRGGLSFCVFHESEYTTGPGAQ
jgi:hypothetical protein